MEVHSHTHPDSYRDSRKKWTHYFWEFLMLFLAVFCGFLAEYQLEHVIEKKREKQFISSLVNDLQLDISSMGTVTNSAKTRIQNIDSVITMLAQTDNNEIPVKCYQHMRRASIQIMFFPNNGTVTQLKSSGGMRLISNRSAVDSIENYDQLIRRLEVRRDITNELSHDYATVLNKAITGKDLLGAVYDSIFFGKKNNKNVLKLNNEYVNELINQCISMRLRAVADTNANLVTKGSALSLIDFLKKEYHLK